MIPLLTARFLLWRYIWSLFVSIQITALYWSKIMKKKVAQRDSSKIVFSIYSNFNYSMCGHIYYVIPNRREKKAEKSVVCKKNIPVTWSFVIGKKTTNRCKLIFIRSYMKEIDYYNIIFNIFCPYFVFLVTGKFLGLKREELRKPVIKCNRHAQQGEN